MSRREDLHPRLAALSVSLARETAEEHDAVVELERLLVRSRIDEQSVLTPRELSIERTSRFSPRTLASDRRARLNDLLDKIPVEEAPQFRVFRREAAVSAPMLDLSTPAWGRGALAQHSVGPLRGEDGRLFWFDFFPIVHLVPLYVAGDPQPVMLFLERIGPPLLARPVARHSLLKSSIWIRASLLAATAPSGGFVGLRVEGGVLDFSVPPADVNGQLTMPAGSTCMVSLQLSPALTPATPPGQAGRDAAAAELSTPDAFAFTLAASHATTTSLASAAWKVYDNQLAFAWLQGAAPTFEPLLQSVVVPMTCAPSSVALSVPQSPFATVQGSADIERSGWTLPVSMIDIANPTEAAGSGGLAVQTGAGVTLGWRGLREGPVVLPNPWLAGGAGLIVVIDPDASNLYAHQRLLLWKDGDSRLRSEMALRFTSSFSVSYSTAATGHELLVAQTDVEARLDRPVDVKGTPFPVRTRKSLLSLTYADDQQLAFVYDDNILVDSLDPASKWPVTAAGGALSLAIRNALFTITPANSLLLFAELLDEETVAKATLLLGMGLYGLLPTLPDPYAANVSWLRRQTGDGRRDARPAMLLVSAVAWEKAAGEDDPDTVSTNFTLRHSGMPRRRLPGGPRPGRARAS